MTLLIMPIRIHPVQAPRRSRSRNLRPHDETILCVNEIWGTDMNCLRHRKTSRRLLAAIAHREDFAVSVRTLLRKACDTRHCSRSAGERKSTSVPPARASPWDLPIRQDFQGNTRWPEIDSSLSFVRSHKAKSVRAIHPQFQEKRTPA